MKNNMSLKEIKCKEENHGGKVCFGLCIDKNCSSKNKLVCPKCILKEHSQHKVIDLDDLEDEINKDNLYYDYIKNDKIPVDSYKKILENDLDKSLEEIKIEMNKQFDSKVEKIKKDYSSYLNKKLGSIDVLYQTKIISNDRTKPNNLNEEIGLAKSLVVIYNLIHNIKDKDDENNEKIISLI